MRVIKPNLDKDCNDYLNENYLKKFGKGIGGGNGQKISGYEQGIGGNDKEIDKELVQKDMYWVEMDKE